MLPKPDPTTVAETCSADLDADALPCPADVVVFCAGRFKVGVPGFATEGGSTAADTGAEVVDGLT